MQSVWSGRFFYFIRFDWLFFFFLHCNIQNFLLAFSEGLVGQVLEIHERITLCFIYLRVLLQSGFDRSVRDEASSEDVLTRWRAVTAASHSHRPFLKTLPYSSARGSTSTSWNFNTGWSCRLHTHPSVRDFDSVISANCQRRRALNPPPTQGLDSLRNMFNSFLMRLIFLLFFDFVILFNINLLRCGRCILFLVEAHTVNSERLQ